MLDAFWDYLKTTDEEIKDYFTSSSLIELFRPDHLRTAVMSYLTRPAKRLRPAVMKLACGCLGGERTIPKLIPLAAGLELFHTWTLVHDDIIDNDDLRRGEKTAHVLAGNLGEDDLHLDRGTSDEYGRSIAILAGDIQHGWVNAAFLEGAFAGGLPLELVAKLLFHLETHVITNLIYGEVLDVQFSLMQDQQQALDEEAILNMEWLKTGILYEFAARSGAMLGKNTTDFQDEDVDAVARFAAHCGIAFQLQDDILGVVGNEQQLGKPVGSDIREGKKTIIVLAALRAATEEQQHQLQQIIGNRQATEAKVRTAIDLLQDCGGVEYARALADSYILEARKALSVIPDSEHKALLGSWAEFMVDREL